MASIKVVKEVFFCNESKTQCMHELRILNDCVPMLVYFTSMTVRCAFL